MTARRYLKQWGYHNSINENARYYALSKIIKFAANGLWNYQGIVFSQHGNLKTTLIYLIEHSLAGLDARELSQQVGIDSNSSFFSQLYRKKWVAREKYQRCFIYFSTKPTLYRQQLKRREQLSKQLN